MALVRPAFNHSNELIKELSRFVADQFLAFQYNYATTPTLLQLQKEYKDYEAIVDNAHNDLVEKEKAHRLALQELREWGKYASEGNKDSIEKAAYQALVNAKKTLIDKQKLLLTSLSNFSLALVTVECQKFDEEAGNDIKLSSYLLSSTQRQHRHLRALFDLQIQLDDAKKHHDFTLSELKRWGKYAAEGNERENEAAARDKLNTLKRKFHSTLEKLQLSETDIVIARNEISEKANSIPATFALILARKQHLSTTLKKAQFEHQENTKELAEAQAVLRNVGKYAESAEITRERNAKTAYANSKKALEIAQTSLTNDENEFKNIKEQFQRECIPSTTKLIRLALGINSPASQTNVTEHEEIHAPQVQPILELNQNSNSQKQEVIPLQRRI